MAWFAAGMIARKSQACAAVKIAVTCVQDWIDEPRMRGGDVFALLAAVPEVVSLLSSVSHLSLSDVSYGVCEPDGAADRVADRAVS